MPRTTRDPFDEDDELGEREDFGEREFPDDDELDWSGEPAVVDCPYCGKEISEDAQLCPHCRSFISFEDAPRRKPWWIWVGVALALLGAAYWVFGH